MATQINCPFCHSIISDEFIYCPNCGKQVKDAPITLSKQIGIYLISIFLPPLGLFPGIKYLFRTDPKAKQVGIIAILLTIVATVVTLWATLGLFNQINSQINSQLDQYNVLLK
ncbi:MAG TPA: zinc ribbon domain-containing protein [Patescibacteria group bacterium]